MLKLNKPTNRTVSGPIIHNGRAELMVEYDYEHDDGTIEWSKVFFGEVLAFEYSDISCCKAEFVASAERITVVPASDWLTDVLSNWQQLIGWQEWQQRQGGAKRFKHYSLFFDNAANLNVIASICLISP